MVADQKLRAAALSDIGRLRGENEDRSLCDVALGVFGVADGLGGLPGGGEAAQEAVDTVAGALRALPPGAMADLDSVVQAANRSVGALGRKISPVLGIATTLTLGWVHSGVLHLAHVGDSRCYGWRGAKFLRLTEDHNVENEARRQALSGSLAPCPGANRRAITRCVGQAGSLAVDLIARPLLAGDRYVFCTDGIAGPVSDREIRAIAGSAADPAAAVRQLVAFALRRGGPDNATAVALFIDQVN